jgi:hypothetical protein
VVVVVMICAGKPGRRMFAHGMFAGNRVVGMRGVGTRGAMIRQGGTVTPQRRAVRTGCCGVTAQAATTAVAASASTHMSAATTAVAASASTHMSAAATATTATRVAASAARGGIR